MSHSLDDIWLEKIGRPGQFSLIQKRRIYRIILVSAAGVSYFIDTILLFLFSYAGTVALFVPLVYGLTGLVHVTLTSFLHWIGFSERLANPHMPFPQLLVGLAVQLMGMAIAPQLTPFFMALIFLVFGFCMLRMRLRDALTGWVICCLSIALVTSHFRVSTIDISAPASIEITVIWIAFSTILLRSIGLGYYGWMLRDKMYERTYSLESAVNKAEYHATHDLLTGVLNRRAIAPAVDELIALCKRKDIPACMVMIDLDRFKSINDNYGHLIGDQVLIALATRIGGMIRDTDKFGRYGGEEFLLLMPATPIDLGLSTVERIRENIAAAPWSEIATGIHLTISCGVTEIKPTDTTSDVITRADQALYEAKHKGRNRVCSI